MVQKQNYLQKVCNRVISMLDLNFICIHSFNDWFDISLKVVMLCAFNTITNKMLPGFHYNPIFLSLIIHKMALQYLLNNGIFSFHQG